MSDSVETERWRLQIQANQDTISALQAVMRRIKALEARVEALTPFAPTVCYWCASPGDCGCGDSQ